MFDIIIIGAGPAGLFAAYELAKTDLKVLVIDKGTYVKFRQCPLMKRKSARCYKCHVCNTMSGIGGAGLNSDGKLNLTAVHGKTNLYEFMSKKKADKLIHYVDDIFINYGAPKKQYTQYGKELEKLKKRAKKYSIKLRIIRQKHIGSDKLPDVIDNFYNYLLKNKVKFMLNTEVEELVVENSKFVGVKLKNKIIKSKFLIAAPGRIGHEWFVNEAKRIGIPRKHRGIEVGIRAEVKADVMKKVTDIIWDPPFFIKTKTGDIIRTFCTCPNGFVTEETYHGFQCVNGYARKDKKSANTNFAFLSNVELTHPAEDTIAYGERIGTLATTIAGGKPFIQRLVDLKNNRRSYWERLRKSKVKPTLQDVTPGDLSMAIPGRIVDNILFGLDKLNKVIPGLTKDMLLYGPELKFFSVRIKTDNHLETPINNLFVAGDGVGVCGNIVGAAATGVIAARGILKKINK